MRNSLNFNHLEVFLTLAKTLSFSKTSEVLKIAQPAISRQIKSLEEYFEQQLFIRTKQTVKLSLLGEKLFDQTNTLYDELNKRVDHLMKRDNFLSGKITFSCFSEVGEKVFIKPLSLFKKKHQGVKLSVNFLKGHEIFEGVKSGKIDIGVVSEKILHENIRCYELLTEEIVLVTRKKNASQNFLKIKSPQFVSYREGDPLLNFYLKKAYSKKEGSGYQVDFSVNSHKSMVDILLSHDLYGVMPSLSISSELNSGKLVNIGSKNLKSSLFLIYLDLEYIDEKVEALSRYLKDYFSSSQ